MYMALNNEEGEKTTMERVVGSKFEGIRSRLWIAIGVLLAMVACSFRTVAAEPGGSARIMGRLLSAENGEPILGASAYLEGTKLGCVSDLDGYYMIKNVPSGTYTLIISAIGYHQITVTSVEVTDGASLAFDFSLKKQVYEMEGIVVKAKSVRTTQAALLKDRQQATYVSDAISAEQISRSGSGNAAEAMTKVTGASVVGGRYVYVRGLGDRYCNTHLNGSPLPSPDPDKQAVPMDLIPSGLLDNIVVEKSFTPDKAGNFAGGSVNFSTKDYPESRTLIFSTSTSFNTLTTGKDILTQNRSSTDWLGYDNGTRDVPKLIKDSAALVAYPPDRINSEKLDSIMPQIEFWDRAYKSFNPQMRAITRQASPNQSHSLSYGDLWQFFDRPLGVVASLSYSHKYIFYDDGIVGRYNVTEDSSLVNPWEEQYRLNDAHGSEEVLWGGLASVKYGIHPKHKLGFTYTYTRNGETHSRDLIGPTSFAFMSLSGDLRSFALTYTERKLRSMQFSGEHLVDLFGRPEDQIRAQWQASFSKTSQQDPDTRFLVDIRTWNERDSVWDYQMGTGSAIARRLWRNLDETSRDYKLDLTIPLFSRVKAKTGTSFSHKERTYRELEYDYTDFSGYNRFQGDVNAWAEDVGFDTIVPSPYPGDQSIWIMLKGLEATVNPRNQYDSKQEIVGVYSMFEFPVAARWTFAGGLRLETTDMQSATQDTLSNVSNAGRIDTQDLLPSASLIYHPTKDMNVRLAYGRTLARPTLREMTPAPSEEFGLSRWYFGNAELKHTKINNYDLRWEWFLHPGEVIAVSAFYKRMDDPIELVIVGDFGEIMPDNSDQATLYGVEFEFRRRLDQFDVAWLPHLSNFQLGGNLTLVKSKVTVPEIEYVRASRYDPETPRTRPLYGQSPYVVNLDLGYDNDKRGTAITLFYNVFGRRLVFNSLGATPDVYEQPRHQVDMFLSQRIFGHGPVLKLSAKNILNSEVKMVHDKLGLPNEPERVYRQYSLGRTYAIGLSYEVW